MFCGIQGRGILVAAAAGWLLAAAAAPAAVSLEPGGSLYKAGYGPTSDPLYATYSTQLPAYCTTDQPVATLTSSIVLPPNTQGPAFHGTVTSKAYRNPAGGLTFTYVFANSGPGTDPVMTVAGFLAADWLGVAIGEAGSDGTGSSGTKDNPEWTNGDPYAINRGSNSAPGFGFQSGNIGTVIGPGDHSAVLWLVTNAPDPRTSTVGLLDGGAVGQAGALVAPEPATLSLLGLGGVALLRRRGHKDEG